MSKQQIVKNRIERLRRLANKEAESYPLEIPKNIKKNKREKLIEDAWILKEGKDYIFSGASRVLLFLIENSKSLRNFTASFKKDLGRRNWERYQEPIKQYFILQKRAKLLGISCWLEIIKGKDIFDYPIYVNKTKSGFEE